MRCRCTSPGRWVRIRLGAGLAFGAFAVSALVLRPFAGRLADLWGRRPLLFGGAVICAVALFLTALVDSLATIVLLRLLVGVAEAAFFVASFAVLADLAPSSRMGEALSYNSLGLYLGLSFGPPLGEVMVDTWGFAAAWCGAGALAACAAVIVLGIGETRSPRSDSDAPPRLIHWKAVPASIGFFTSIAAHRRIPRLRVLARRRGRFGQHQPAAVRLRRGRRDRSDRVRQGPRPSCRRCLWGRQLWPPSPPASA